MKPFYRLFAPLTLLLLACGQRHHSEDWLVYGGGKENRHYSALTQIDTGNVTGLRVAWTYHSQDADAQATQIQVNGLESGGVFYGVSPGLKLFALDAASGEQLWRFDPAFSTRKGGGFSMNVCRGVTLYHGGGELRIFFAAGGRLFCVDATTGKPINSFGYEGSIDLHDGLDRDVQKLFVSETSPGIIYKNLIIVGTRVDEATPAAPGYIRAYDVHTGKRAWIFHTIPWPTEEGYSSWDDPTAWRYAGGVNAWAGFSMDEERGIVFAPLGSASYDFYGGNRKGSDLYANCVLALDAATGRQIWHYQTVHHDLWDRDLPTAPVLVTLHKDGRLIDALAQITKSGYIFLLDRTTGAPVYPVTEMPVHSQSELNGEQPWPTQPEPTFPAPFARQHLSDRDLNRLVPDSSIKTLRAQFARYHKDLFDPPSREGSLVFPGFDGGGEWGGPSYDPVTGILYINASEMPWILTMIDAPKPPIAGTLTTNLGAGKTLYAEHCMGCHGTQRQGGGNYPSLLQTPGRYTLSSFSALLESGRRMMPAFRDLGMAEKTALAAYVLNDVALQKGKYTTSADQENAYDRMPFISTGYNKFLTPEGYPAIMPPWGSLTAVDLHTGAILWKDTLGDYPEFKAKGIHTGTENYGGSVVTAGGVLFIAATKDSKFRAFNKRTGRLLWETDLPACGFATPAVYDVDGREYVVIACGGGKLKQPSGDCYVAFALP